MLSSITNNPDVRHAMGRGELEQAIRQHAEQELLHDQPYEDRRKIRVSGRFTVESLSPHRVLEPRDDVPATVDGSQFETMIVEHLRKAGVQNTYKGERLEFDRLEPYAGEWIQADGEFTQDGETQRVSIAIGPEHGTVGPDLIRDAAIEAGKAIPPYDLVVVTGFAFDPHAWETAKEITADVAERKVGRVRVLLARANPDLAMGGDLLKATGSGNLFMVFGEPDIDIRYENGDVTVEIKGLDVYDPTTGEVRSSSTKDIAAWFIDSDYDDKSFFVRHAYFTGGHTPYESLQKALRAEIDEDAWATLYSTVSRPFPGPSTGKIAVKVINHYGDEVMQVYELAR